MKSGRMPKAIEALKDYSVHKFASDALAGLTVGLVALPLAMAFAISSGVPPQAGLYCAVIAGFLISALGGSKMQIGGPTGAFVVVVYGIVAQHGLDGLFLCTTMAGVFLVVLGLTGLGTAVRYLPRPVVVGFTNGIAVLIASTQIKDFFGLRIDKVPGEFLGRIEALAAHFDTISLPSTIVAASALLSAILLVVAYNMGEWKEVPKLLKMTSADISVWLVTFALTVFADLTVAVEFGIVLAALLFIRRVAQTTTVAKVTREYVEDGRLHSLQHHFIPDYITVVRIHGPFLFGATENLSAITDQINTLSSIVILRLRNMTAIDATGLLALEDLADKLVATGRNLVLCGARPQPARLMRKAEFERHVGRQNICPNIRTALDRSQQIHDSRFTSAA